MYFKGIQNEKKKEKQLTLSLQDLFVVQVPYKQTKNELGQHVTASFGSVTIKLYPTQSGVILK